MAKVSNEFRTIAVELQVPIDASPAKVWDAIVKDSSKWWPRDFYAGADAKGFIFEPRLGGRVYEDWGDGAGLMWYDVIGIDPQTMLLLRGYLTSQYGGPANTLLELRLEPRGKGTTLHLRDNVYGHVGPKTEQSLKSGWQTLMGKALKKFVETKSK